MDGPQARETTLTPGIHQRDMLEQREITPKIRPHEETISKNINNQSKTVPHQKVYKSVISDIAGNDKQKSMLMKIIFN